MVDLEVVGRHALLFDDDAMAAFVNSTDALLQWNSLLIDRYDVRHLLHDVLPPPKRRRTPPLLEQDGVSPSDLDSERFQDLPPNDEDGDDPLSETNRQDSAAGKSYQAVSFSYGNNVAAGKSKNSDNGLSYSGFLPPFPVPESLLENLPPSEKVHQIMARTAKFVREHGGQSEIVLRVKQGDNPTFGFLMPDHRLHAYFRFLVEHPELLKAETDVKASEEEKKVDSGKNQTHVAGGALTLLGSVYGSGEDEDGALHVTSVSKEMQISHSADAVNMNSSHGPDLVESSVDLAAVVDTGVNHSSVAAKPANIEKVSPARRGSCATTVSSGTTCGKIREAGPLTSPAGSFCFSENKPQLSSKLSMSEPEPVIVEPPPYLKRMIDQTVEFIQRNGREFEAVLIKQDSSQGKFQFLLPSNHYYPYYLKLLLKAQESKILGKNVAAQKLDSQGHKTVKEKVQDAGRLKDDDKGPSKEFSSRMPSMSSKLQEACGSGSERKHKFKMVIGGSKKENVDLQSKPVRRQGGLSVDEAAAIVLAATRGHANSKVDSLLKGSFNDSGTGCSVGVVANTSSTGSFSFLLHAQSSLSKPLSYGEQGLLKSELPESVQQSDKGGKSTDVSVAKAIAKTVALASASEADSSEASLTREEKLKAERLKRAKMFAAMIKGGGNPTRGPLPQLSVQGPDSTPSGLIESGGKFPVNGDSMPVAAASNVLSSGSGDHLSREREGSSVPVDVSVSDKMGKKKYSDDDDDDESKDRERRSRKKHGSRSRKHEDSDKDQKHSRKRHRSEHPSHYGRDDHKHMKSHSSHKDREHRRRRHRHRHHNSSEDELEQSRSHKHRSQLERDLEEGEVDQMVSDHSDSKEIEHKAMKAANNLREGSVPSVTDNQSFDATEVPDQLREKVRAMLLATM